MADWKEIKAFIHRNRVSDVVRALKKAGFKDLSVIDVKGILKALDRQEQEYSIEIGEKVITEVKVELVCENNRLNEAVNIIRDNAQTGQAESGCIYVSDIDARIPIHLQ